jgi:putative hydrolase of the HAD superfamily
MIKHISFDLWLTLIKSNPEFKLKRNELFFDDYNPQQLSLEHVSAKIKEIDIMVDRSNEMLVNSVPSIQIYSLVLSALGNRLTADEIWGIKEHCNSLFLENLPELYSLETKSYLQRLSETCSLSILSNTGFIESEVLEIMLEKLGIKYLFDFCTFSDEYDLSKPSSDFFNHAFTLAKRRNMSLQYSDVLHVGDNEVADKGGDFLGFKTQIINSNSKTIEDVFKYVTNYNQKDILVTSDR